MEFLQSLLENCNVPVITAFLLGLLTALSPCPLATNMTAIGFISKNIESKHRIFMNGILYTLGRVIVYVGIGIILIPIIRQGASVYAIQKAISSYGEILIAPALILIGLFMLFGDKLNLPKLGISTGEESCTYKGSFGALLLGILFALAFCPSSGLLYFGMLIPMAAAESGGALLPIVFAVATGLPVIIVAWILAYSISELGAFYNRMKVFQKWLNLAVALLFIAVGIYYGFVFYM